MNGFTSTGITLTDTCPLDNWFIIFQALIKSNKVKLGDLPESGHTTGTAQRLIDDGFYADAKSLILQSLPQRQPGKYLSDILGVIIETANRLRKGLDTGNNEVLQR